MHQRWDMELTPSYVQRFMMLFAFALFTQLRMKVKMTGMKTESSLVNVSSQMISYVPLQTCPTRPGWELRENPIHIGRLYSSNATGDFRWLAQALLAVALMANGHPPFPCVDVSTISK